MARPEPPKIRIGWFKYFRLLRKLFEIISRSGFKPQQIVCISSGGLIPGKLASVYFGVPLAVLSVSSYPDGATKQEEVHFSRDLTTAHPLKRHGVLVIDDLTETGTTLTETVKWLCHWYGIEEAEICTATIWHKLWSAYKPDFYAEEIPEGRRGERPWIIQPHEQFRNGNH